MSFLNRGTTTAQPQQPQANLAWPEGYPMVDPKFQNQEWYNQGVGSSKLADAKQLETRDPHSNYPTVYICSIRMQTGYKEYTTQEIRLQDYLNLRQFGEDLVAQMDKPNLGTENIVYKPTEDKSATGSSYSNTIKDTHQNIGMQLEVKGNSIAELRMYDYSKGLVFRADNPNAGTTSSGFNTGGGFGTSTSANSGFNTNKTGFGVTSQPSGFGSSTAGGFGTGLTGGFGNTNASSGFGTSTATGSFGTGGGFGSKPATGFGVTSTSGGFGSNTNATPGFGNTNTTSGFGNTNAPSNFGTGATPGGFGTGSGFGAKPSTGFGTTNTLGGFGKTNTGGGFGTTANTGFGTSGTSLAATSTGGFNTATSSGFGFGQKPASFGSQPTGGLFATNTQQPTTSFPGFNATNPAPTSTFNFGSTTNSNPTFGFNTKPAAGSLFNSSAAPSSTSIFGANNANSTFNPGASSTSLFGQTNPATALGQNQPFGQTTATNPSNPLEHKVNPSTYNPWDHFNFTEQLQATLATVDEGSKESISKADAKDKLPTKPATTGPKESSSTASTSNSDNHSQQITNRIIESKFQTNWERPERSKSLPTPYWLQQLNAPNRKQPNRRCQPPNQSFLLAPILPYDLPLELAVKKVEEDLLENRGMKE